METTLHKKLSTRTEAKHQFRPTVSSGLEKIAFADGGPLEISETAPKTLTEAFLKTAAWKNKGLIIVSAHGEKNSVSYAELSERAKCILAGLQKNGLRPGSRTILQLDSLADHFTAFWACVLGGIVPVTVAIPPAYSEKHAVVKKLHNTWQLLEAPTILASAHLLSSIQSVAERLSMTGLKLLSVDELKNESATENIHPASPDDVIFYQLTSGSTGIPKCIQETHRSIIAHIHGSGQFNDYTPDDITLNWLPMDHVVPILTCHLKDIYLGCNEIQVKTDYILSEPLRWLDLMNEHRVTHTWAPNFGFKLVADALAQRTDNVW